MEQTKPFTLINQAVMSYNLDFQSLELIRVSLTTHGQHGDLHYKILIDGHPYSIRLLPKKRYVNSDLSQSTPDLLTKQLRYTDYLRAHGIPFMERVKPSRNALFTTITDPSGQNWTCCLFHWMDGHHVTVNTRHTAARMGTLARQLHDVCCINTISVFHTLTIRLSINVGSAIYNAFWSHGCRNRPEIPCRSI
ncbi:hypothetical protein [Exiguobacterium artemiae]|uniref:hypothetical protein n=1 Tax=Exiguobacterium artemiae TaxID=340145 RepID=UPI003D0635E3